MTGPGRFEPGAVDRLAAAGVTTVGDRHAERRPVRLALPLRLVGFDGSPVRAVLREPASAGRGP